jgi:putative redox protein
MPNPNDRDYSNGEIVVHWRPDKCVHCEACIHGLPEVFDLNKRPWVNMSGAMTARIVEQVAKCPEGALTVTNQVNEG